MPVKFFRQNPSIFLITATISIAITLIRNLGYLQSAELSAYDRMIQSRPKEPIDERIIIVGITEADIRKHKQYPFSDALYAELLKRIKAQKPRVIGLDIVRDIPEPPGSQDLEEVFKTTPNLIGAGTLPEKDGNDYTKAIAFPPILKAFHKPTAPRIGDVRNPVDEDYVVRRGFLYPVRDETAPLGMKQPPKSFESGVPSFGLAVARQYLAFEGIEAKPSPDDGWLALGKVTFYPFNFTDGGYNRPPIKGYQILLNWRSSAGAFKHVSVSEVMEGKIAPTLLKDRIVLIGAYAPSLKDIVLTPFVKGNPKEQPPYGIEVHAHLTSQIISAVLDDRSLINVLPDWVEILWLVVWIGVTTGGIGAARRFKNPILYLLIVSVYCGILTYLVNLITFQVFLLSWWLPSFYVLLGVWSSSAIAYTWSLNSQRLNEQRERIKEQQERLQEKQERLQEKQQNEQKLEQKIQEKEQELQESQQVILAQEYLVFLGENLSGFTHECGNVFQPFRTHLEALDINLKDLKEVLMNLEIFQQEQQELEAILTTLESSKENLDKVREKGVALFEQFLPVAPDLSSYRQPKKEVDLNTFVKNCCLLEIKNKERQISLSISHLEEYDSSIGTVEIVSSEINFVLRNLIANACDALKEKEKQQLDNFNPSIKLITKKITGKIQIIIQDNGIEINPKEETEIFKIYFTTKPPGKGTGLGLFTAQKFIIGRYGGNLYYQGVETDEGRQKQFVVEISI